MKTLYGNLKVPKLLKLPALIVLLLALSYTARSQSSNSPVCIGTDIQLSCTGGVMSGCGDPTARYSWTCAQSTFTSSEQNPIIPANSPNYVSGQYYLSTRVGSAEPYTYYNGFCSVLFNTPTTPVIGGTLTVCAGAGCQTYTTQSGMTNYNWTVVGGTPSGSGATVCVSWGSGVTTRTIQVSFTDANSCTATSSTSTVTVTPLPIPIVSGPASACEDVAGNVYTTQSGMTGYTWNVGDGAITAGGGSDSPTVTVTWPNAGLRTVTVLYTDPTTGCTATQTGVKTTTVNATPATPSISPESGTGVCTLSGNVYTATAIANATYTWNVTGPAGTTSTPNGSTVTVNWGASGTGTITVYATVNGCQGATTTNTYSIVPINTFTIGGPTYVCMSAGSATASYTVTVPNATGYTWNVTGGSLTSGQGTNEILVSYATAGTATISCTATNTTCSNVNTVTVAVGATPTPTVTGPSEVCNNGCGVYYTENFGTAPNTEYNWVVTSSGTATITAGHGTNSITVCWGAAGTGTVQVKVKIGECEGTSPIHDVTIGATITNLEILTSTPPALDKVCQNKGGWNYYAEADGAALDSYQWAITGPSTSTITSVQSNVYSITVYWGTPPPTNGTVNVVVTRDGCTAMVEEQLDILAPPVVTTPTVAVGSACSGTKVRFHTTEGMCNYNWDWPSGNVSTYTYETGVETTSHWVDLTVSAVATVTSFNVSVQYSNVCPYNGCNDGAAATKSITVYPIPVAPVINASADAICDGGSVTYTIGNLAALNGTGFAWNTTGSTATPSPASGSLKTFTVTWDNTSGVDNQIGKVNLTFTSAGGCTSTNTRSTTVYPTVTPVINGDGSACIGDTKQYTTTPGMSNYNWTINNAAASITTGINTATITVKFWVAGQTDLTVTYTDNHSCPSGIGTKSVMVHDLPVVTISGPDQACEGTTVTYYTQSGNGEYDWSWTLPAGGGTIVSAANTATITVTWNTMGARSVAVTYKNVYGCSPVAPTVYDVTVGELDVPAISYPTNSLPVCQYSTGNNYYVGGGHPKTGWIYSWNLTGPNGSVITAGQNTYSVTVTWGGPGTTTGTLWVDATNTNVTPNCTGTSEVLFIPILAPPATPTITGSSSVCSSYPNAINTATSVYTTDAGMYNYKWEVTGAAGLVTSWTGQGTNSIIVKLGNGVNGGTFTVKVTYSNDPANNCKNSYERTITVKPNEMPTITPTPANVCAGSSQIFNTENSSPISGWTWTVAGKGIGSGGWTGQGSATVTVNWPASTTPYAGTATVYYNGMNGCRSQVKTITVTVNGQPTTPVISGPSVVCANIAGQTIVTSQYTCTNAGLNASYTWTVNGNLYAATTGSGRTITVTWGAAGVGTVTVLATINGVGGNCTAISSAYPVVINPTDVPVIISVTDPFDIVCQNTGGHIYQTVSGMAQYTWETTGPGTTTTTFGQFNNPVTVFWGGPGPAIGNLKVSVVNTYGCPAISDVKTVTISAAQPTMAGDFEFCGYENTWHTYTAGASSVGDYVWTLGPGVVSYTTLTGSQSINVMFESNYDHTNSNNPYISYVTVSYTGDCSSAQSLTKSVTVNPVPTPELDVEHSGPWTVCQGGQGSYMVKDCIAPNTYEFLVSGGFIVEYLQSGCGVKVQWTTCPSGTIQVNELNAYGCVATSQVYTVTILQKPAPHIFGPLTVNTNQTATYWTSAHGDNIYSWSVVGGTIVGGQGTSTITVDWGPVPPCWCGTVQVVESTIDPQTGIPICTGTDIIQIDLLPSDYTISGYLSYKNDYNTKLNGVEVILKDAVTGSIIATTETGPNMLSAGEPGFFAFVNIPEGSYLVIPHGDGDNSWGGNNATDALIVQLNTLSCGLDPLNCVVADVNASGAINATDALNIKLRVVGMVGYYAAGDWKYEVEPVAIDEYETPVYLPDMKGLCVGDVNGSYIPQGMKAASLLSSVDNGLQTVPVNAPFTYELRSNSEAGIGAMTLFMSYDESKFEVEKVNTVLDGMKYSIANGQIALAWSDTKTLNVENNDVIISLQVRAKVALTEATNVFDLQAGSEFADAFAQPFSNFELKMGKLITTGLGEFSLGNYPNPFKNSTDIVYTLPETGTVKLIVTDMLGKTVTTLVNGVVQDAGTYKVTVNGNDGMMKPGVYLYRIEVEGENASFVKTNKMTLTR